MMDPTLISTDASIAQSGSWLVKSILEPLLTFLDLSLLIKARDTETDQYESATPGHFWFKVADQV